MTLLKDLYEFLKIENVKKDEPLKHYTYTKTGGIADYLVFPTTYEEVQKTIQYANTHQIPVTILGNGSNLIVKDGGIRGIVLNLLKLTHITRTEDKIVVQSGVEIIKTSRFALTHELEGLEFACGIPGSVGGAVFMNAGAYDGEISNVLESVLVLTREGDFRTIEKKDLQLSYRHSIVAEMNYLVLEATFSLKAGEYQNIKGKMDNFTFLRESNQPLEYPSCGSVFKRPPGNYAGKLIQDSGLQGHQIGGVQISTKHAGFMVNVAQGTASDYIHLIRHTQSEVKNRFGIELEAEVKIIGED